MSPLTGLTRGDFVAYALRVAVKRDECPHCRKQFSRLQPAACRELADWANRRGFASRNRNTRHPLRQSLGPQRLFHARTNACDLQHADSDLKLQTGPAASRRMAPPSSRPTRRTEFAFGR